MWDDPALAHPDEAVCHCVCLGLPDVTRHPDARTNMPKQLVHDQFALPSCFSQYHPKAHADGVDCPWWRRALGLLLASPPDVDQIVTVSVLEPQAHQYSAGLELWWGMDHHSFSTL